MLFRSVKLCRISSSRTLICVTDESFNGYTQSIAFYEYKNNKLKKIFDLAEITRDKTNTLGNAKPSKAMKKSVALSGWARGNLVSVGKNTVKMQWSDTAGTAGIFATSMEYKIKGNKATRVGNSYKTTFSSGWPEKRLKTLTANRAFQTYTTAGGKKNAFRVKKNQKVQIVSMRVKNGKRYIRVRNNKGTTGWYQDLYKYSKSKGTTAWFKEAWFAG